MEYSPLFIALLFVIGFIAGIINVLAAGGSNLTLPALMLLGLPADVANATNRVGIFLQSVVAIRGFHSHGKLPTQNLLPMLLPLIGGSLVGSLAAAFFPPQFLKPVLLLTMVSMSLVILISPKMVLPEQGEEVLPVKGNRKALVLLLISGFYGGFIQAGVGFILIAAFAGGLRFDMVRANALKVLAAGCMTAIALVVFILRDQVVWIPGLILASANMAGAYIGVRLALNISQNAMKWFIFIMTLVASLAALIGD